MRPLNRLCAALATGILLLSTAASATAPATVELVQAPAWVDRAGRFRSLGDGQVDFVGIFSKLAQYGFDGWAVVEWECCIKHPEDGAREGAEFVAAHIIRVTEKAFDDFAGAGTDRAANRKMLGLGA